MTITAAQETAMVEAHKTGRILARNGASRRLINEVAKRLSVAEGDAALAGYYGELRRLRANQR